MDLSWKQAFKNIHGFSPTKKVIFSTSELQNCEPGSSADVNQQRISKPRKTIRLKRPCVDDDVQPLKACKLKCLKNLTSTTNFSLSKNSRATLLSPLKNSQFFSPNLPASPATPISKPSLTSIPTTPSPRKSVRKNGASRNIHFLMFSPEKPIHGDVEAGGDSENLAKSEETLEMFETVSAEEITEPKPKRQRTDVKGNYVRLNLRKKCFVKKKIDPRKKKWLKRFKNRRFK